MENEQATTEVVSTEEVAQNTETEPTEEPAETQEEVPEVKEEEVVIPPPKKQTAQERINAVIKKQREAEREAEHWKRLAEQKEQVAQTSYRPQIENYPTQEAYEDALFEWRDAGKQQQIQRYQATVAEQEAVSKFKAGAEKMKEVYEDFDEVVEQPVFTPTMREVLLNSDDGAMVAYFLGRDENHAVAEKIRNLPVKLQVYELGKLEERLKLAKKTQKPTGAPSPISPVGATGGKQDKDQSKWTDDEWFAWRKQEKIKQIKQKSGG
jgi:hypothetical protein